MTLQVWMFSMGAFPDGWLHVSGYCRSVPPLQFAYYNPIDILPMDLKTRINCVCPPIHKRGLPTTTMQPPPTPERNNPGGMWLEIKHEARCFVRSSKLWKMLFHGHLWLLIGRQMWPWSTWGRLLFPSRCPVCCDVEGCQRWRSRLSTDISPANKGAKSDTQLIGLWRKNRQNPANKPRPLCLLSSGSFFTSSY